MLDVLFDTIGTSIVGMGKEASYAVLNWGSPKKEEKKSEVKPVETAAVTGRVEITAPTGAFDGTRTYLSKADEYEVGKVCLSKKYNKMMRVDHITLNELTHKNVNHALVYYGDGESMCTSAEMIQEPKSIVFVSSVNDYRKAYQATVAQPTTAPCTTESTISQPCTSETAAAQSSVPAVTVSALANESDKLMEQINSINENTTIGELVNMFGSALSMFQHMQPQLTTEGEKKN